MTDTQTHEELIDRLGGVTKVARALGIENLSVVGNWRTRPPGVPWKWRPAVAHLAEKAAVPLPPDFLPPVPAESEEDAAQ